MQVKKKPIAHMSNRQPFFRLRLHKLTLENSLKTQRTRVVEKLL